MVLTCLLQPLRNLRLWLHLRFEISIYYKYPLRGMIHCKITKVFDEVNMQQVGHDFHKIQIIPGMDEHLICKQLMIITYSSLRFL